MRARSGRTRAMRAAIAGRSWRIAAILAAAALWAAPAADAADSVYWTNSAGSSISFASLDGSGGGDLEVGDATLNNPAGLAIDPAVGRVYWANLGGSKISFANLDGSGGGDLNTTGATLFQPMGLALDPAGGRVYWASQSHKISFANLDGSGGDDLDTMGATLDTPRGVALDPAAARIYWANQTGGGSISFANLDGSGGDDLDTTGATVDGPQGPAIDPAAGRVYWSNPSVNTISFASLDGSGGDDLAITGATVDYPQGLAIDPAAGRLYWANAGGGKISFANLDGSGGEDLTTSGATLSAPGFPALLKTPSGTGAPAITGGSAVGSMLSCSQASWAPDLLGSFLYRAPRSSAYGWTRNGAAIAGAAASSITASSGGDYRCQVTAQNHAGATEQASAPHTVAADNSFKLGKLKLNTKKGTATLAVTVPGSGRLTLGGKGIVPQRPASRNRASRRLAKPVGAAGTVKLLIKAKSKAKKKLNKAGKVKVKARITFKPTGGTANTKTKPVKLKKRA